MQSSSQHSYPGSYQLPANAYPGARYYQHQLPHVLGAHITTHAQSGGDGYGLYNAPLQPSIHTAAYNAPDGLHDSPRASKRPRLNAQEDAPPTRTRGQPTLDEQSQHVHQPRSRSLKGAALPPSRIGDSSPRQDFHEERNHVSQRTHPNNIPSHLELQVHGVAEYDQGNNDRRASFIPGQHHDSSRSSADAIAGQIVANSPPMMLPQRGAKEGNVLNLACVMCMKKKRKCSKNFPCNECQKFHDQCVPSVRKVRPMTVSNEEQGRDVPTEETEDASRPTHASEADSRVSRDPNNPHRKYLMTLPAVVDGYQEWSNMRTKYNPIPKDLDEVREKIFALEKPILLQSQQFADYWPHVSNIWARSVGPWWDRPDGLQLETWECRNQRRQSRSQRLKASDGKGLRKRESKLHLIESTETCKLRFRLSAHIKHAENDEDHKKGLGSCNCVPEWILMERMAASLDLSHNHSLDSMDKFKRTDGLLLLAERKVVEDGYQYAAVRKWMQAKYSHLTKQVSYLTDHDVANAARRWRVQNRELELIDTIPEPNPDDERREKCLELLHTSTNDGLKQALKEICKRLPEAAKIALPVLESLQIDNRETATNNSKILEGDEIAIPMPGIPGHRLNTLFEDVTPPPQPAQLVGSQIQPSSSSAPEPVQQRQSQPRPEQAAAQNAASSIVMLQQQPLLVPPQPLLPASAHGAGPSLVQNMFHVYLSRAATSLPKPPNGAYSVNSGDYRPYISATGSMLRPVHQDNRPSWAQPGVAGLPAATEKEVERPDANDETDKLKVQRQLDAELQPLSDE